VTEPAPDALGVVGWVDADALVETSPTWVETTDTDDLLEALEAAHEQCLDFLNGRVPWRIPPDEDAGTPGVAPARLVLAQKLQARALLRSTYTGSRDEIGPDGMTVTVFPMDWTVKNLLRPRRGRRGPR